MQKEERGMQNGRKRDPKTATWPCSGLPQANLATAAMTPERSLQAAGPPKHATGLANVRACLIFHVSAA
jgi:hypothetical protein